MHKRETKFPLQHTVSRGLVSFLAFSVATVLASPSNAFPFYHGYDQDTQPQTQTQTQGAEDAVVVKLNNRLRFVPREIRINVGDTVEWRNVESIAHTVTADLARVANRRSVELPANAEPFDSGWVRRGQTFRYTFTEPGVYRYVCLPHEGRGMLGTVIVG